MAEPLSAITIKSCVAHGVEIAPDAVLGFARQNGTLLESPVNIRRGTYDIDFVGAYSYMGGRATFMRHIASVGRFCSIASNIITGQVEHPTDFLSASPIFTGAKVVGDLSAFYEANRAMVDKATAALRISMANRTEKIQIGNDVWLGEGVFIRRGVTIGDGAVIAARSVVTNHVPPYAIVGGVPAKIIRFRFPHDVIDELLRLQWWNYGLSALEGVDFTDIDQAITVIDRNITTGKAQPYSAPLVNVGTDGQATVWRYDTAKAELVPFEDLP